jgi:hypothetical protein
MASGNNFRRVAADDIGQLKIRAADIDEIARTASVSETAIFSGHTSPRLRALATTHVALLKEVIDMLDSGETAYLYSASTCTNATKGTVTNQFGTGERGVKPYFGQGIRRPSTRYGSRSEPNISPYPRPLRNIPTWSR